MQRLKLIIIIACSLLFSTQSISSINSKGHLFPTLNKTELNKVNLNNSGVYGQQIESDETPDGLSKLEWQSIQDQVARGSYKAYINDTGGYQSSNPAHGWQIDYDQDGTTTLKPSLKSNAQDKIEDYHISLRLNAVSFRPLNADDSNGFDEPLAIDFNRERLNYHWNQNITEYWINSEEKLEQWFEIQQRPESQGNLQKPLQIQMTLDTDLEVSLKNNRLTLGDITYDQLKVWDAKGDVVNARLELQGSHLSILLDEQLAIYPLTIDPSFSQSTYLKASNTEANDEFGRAVSISGDTLVVGARLESSSATGVNGDQSNNGASNSGAAYVFVRNGSSWSQQAYLKASNTGAGDGFGNSISISGDTLVVGSSGESSAATGVNGDEDDGSVPGAGAAYVFVRNGTTWSQQAYLKASDSDRIDRFGESVSISGDTVVVGASSEGSAATGVNGDDSDDSAARAGAAYVFVRSGTTWSHQAYLKASNTDAGDQFGFSVSVSGDTVVVSSRSERGGATGVNGDQSDNSAFAAGAVYAFVRSGSTWTQQAYIKPSNTGFNDQFGFSVFISGDTLIVGAPGEDSAATGVNGDESDNSAVRAGAAYVFTRSGVTWAQQTYLKASNAESDDNFGFSVSLSGDNLLVSSLLEASNATGVDGNQNNNSTTGAGAVYAYTRSGTTWTQQAYLKASNPDSDDQFGYSVAVSGDTLAISSLNEASNATGIGGNQNNDSATSAGAVYAFDISYSVGGVVTGLGAGNNVVLQNNGGDDLMISANGLFSFPTDLTDGDTYAATVLTQPNAPDQLCGITGASGTVNAADVSGLVVDCNFAPTVVQDSRTIAEDNMLNATDANGTGTTDLNDNSVLVNDSDIESDELFVVTPGTFTAGGIGGSITINANGTFSYMPPTNEFGNATFNYQVSDGLSTLDAQLVIVVLSVNDAPTVVQDSRTTAEDNVLNAPDEDGTGTTDLNDNSVLVNDSDIESDELFVVTPGTFTASGIGGSITINANGTFSYIPPTNEFGNATFNYEVSDGLSTSDAQLAIAVLSVNDAPTVVQDSRTITEDNVLNATDANGTGTTDLNDNSVLVNDSDIESDELFVVTPGTFTAGGIGGSITINANGTFSYMPPTNEFGNATFNYEVSDGLSTLDAQLTIAVLSVNDAPSFSLAGDVIVDLFNTPNLFNVPSFITDFSLGPDNESDQQISDYEVTIQSDSMGVLNAVDVDNNGTLSIDFTTNVGVALIDISLQDDGGVADGGVDTSPVQSFFIAMNNDIIFLNSFEGLDDSLILTHLIQIQTATTDVDYPLYDFESGLIEFYNEQFYLNGPHHNQTKLESLKNWLNEVLIYKAPYGDYDRDGVDNYLDAQPFKKNALN